MERRTVVEVVAGIAAGQWGMFTTAQAAAVGVSRLEVARLVDAGLVRRVRQGVHVMPGVPSDAFEEVRAEWLATDPTRTAGERRSDADPVVVSDETAAAIHGIGDLSAGGVHLTASRRLQTRQAWVSVHQRTLTAKEYQWIDGLPVTTPRRTLEDLAASGRWEHSQLHDLAMDAITQALIPSSEVARSPILIRAFPELAPPVSHASLRQRLANDARERGAEPRATYNTFFRMLFLAGLADHDGWVLKGGTNLVCRLTSPRSTLDLDLFRQGDASPTLTSAALHDVMDGHTAGRYTFRVGDPTLGDGEDIEVARVKVTVFDGATLVESFNIDLSGDIVLNAEPDRVEVPRGDSAVLPGYPATIPARLYPIENQIADKLCALYTRYGSGPSTRYRDLYDLAMIVDQLPFEHATLTAALGVQQRVRRMALPAALGEPAPGWAAAYDRQLSRTPGARPPFTNYDEAIAVVRDALSPALPNNDDATR
ncbi:MAG: nucleotidyl transferase AbiEii/AbiGii toxin family protein [Propionicimonas sp.]